LQLNHYNSKFKPQHFAVTLICDNVTNAPNIGSLFRITDAFGISELILCGDTVSLGKRMRKTSRATEKYINYSIQKDIVPVIDHFKALNHTIIALEITEDSLPLETLQLQINTPVVLIIGNENFGISESVLQHSDLKVHINMFGHNSSMNVV